MGDAVLARTSPTLHPPSPPTVQSFVRFPGETAHFLHLCDDTWQETRQKTGTQGFQRLVHGHIKAVISFKCSYCSLKPLWSGMGDAVPARTSPTLHPPSPPTVQSFVRFPGETAHFLHLCGNKTENRNTGI